MDKNLIIKLLKVRIYLNICFFVDFSKQILTLYLLTKF